jgi:hypothetical protein
MQLGTQPSTSTTQKETFRHFSITLTNSWESGLYIMVRVISRTRIHPRASITHNLSLLPTTTRQAASNVAPLLSQSPIGAFLSTPQLRIFRICLPTAATDNLATTSWALQVVSSKLEEAVGRLIKTSNGGGSNN